MVHFKEDAIEQLLEQHKTALGLVACQGIRRTISRGADGMDPGALVSLCKDLKCLPVDIMEYQ